MGTTGMGTAGMSTTMTRTLLVRGMVAGVIAGLMGTAFAYLVGEGPVDAAIGFESATAAHGGHDEVELVSRGVQSTAGLLVAVTAYGVAVGGLFALAFVLSLGRIGEQPAVRVRAVALAATGFVVMVLVPFLEYPANPPSVGRPETIGERTALYFGFTALSVLAFALAIAGRARLRVRLGAFDSAVVAGAAYLVLVVLAGRLLSGVDEVPQAFPAPLLWTFRLSSLGTQVVLWGSLGLAFGALADPVVGAEARARRRAQAFAA